MRYHTYERDRKTHTFPVATVGSGYEFGLVPADMVTHVMDETSFGLVVSVCCDAVSVLWSIPPRGPFV